MQKGVDGESKKERNWQKQKVDTKEKRPPQAPPEEGMWEDTVGYGGSLSLELRPPQAPPGGGDVPGGIRIAGCWGNRRTKI